MIFFLLFKRNNTGKWTGICSMLKICLKLKQLVIKDGFQIVRRELPINIKVDFLDWYSHCFYSTVIQSTRNIKLNVKIL